MRILWASNAPWANTGYGRQTAAVTRRLKVAGHEVAIASNFGIAQLETEWEGIRVYPNAYDAYGLDVLPFIFNDWANGEPALLITLYDTWIYNAAMLEGIPLASWTPVDHAPVPPAVEAWAQGHDTIAMSRFGEHEFAKRNIKATYIPHTIEPDIFHPWSPEERAETRALAGYQPDDFVVLINAANKGNHPPRKAWSEMFLAMAVFMDSHPDVRLHLHTENEGFHAIDLIALTQGVGIPISRVTIANPGRYKMARYSDTYISRLYDACDVLLSTSMGEGFGLAVVEAQATGTPVIVSAWTAQPELVGGGWVAAVQPWWDDAHKAFFCTPIVASIVEQLEAAYAARGDEDIRAKAIAKAAEYEGDKVFAEHWVPFLATWQERLRTPSSKPRIRNERRKKRKRA